MPVDDQAPMQGHSPPAETPRVRADLNTQGWGRGGDTAFYVLDPIALVSVHPQPGRHVFLWDDDGPGTLLGWIGVLEHVQVGTFTSLESSPHPWQLLPWPWRHIFAARVCALMIDHAALLR